MKRVLMILFVVAVIASGWVIYAQGQEPKEQSLPEGVRTETVTRGEIEALVSATGSIAAQESEQLTFATAGEIAEVAVQEGDQVQAGQMLARLDITDLENSLTQAEASLKVAEAQLQRARKPATAEEIASAEAAVAAAKASFEDLQAGASWREKQLAKLAVDRAKNNLYGAQGNRDAVKGSPVASGGAKAQAEAQVLVAEVQVREAELRYQQLFEPADASAIAQAESQIAQAESNLARLRSLPSPEEISVAEAQVEQARVNVDVARSRLNDEDLVLEAPFAGELVTWDLDEGDAVSPGAPVGRLVDTGSYHIRVNIDETEIGQIRMDQEARITLDAFPDEEIMGHVTDIDLMGENIQGIVSYGVDIEIDPTTLDIRPLMTAAIDIIVDRVEDALLVPNRALRRDREGIYVEVVQNGSTEQVYIETGVDNAGYTEVAAGLEEGQRVIVSRPRENIFGGGPFGG